MYVCMYVCMYVNPTVKDGSAFWVTSYSVLIFGTIGSTRAIDYMQLSNLWLCVALDTINKTAFNLHVIDRLSDDYNFWYLSRKPG